MSRKTPKINEFVHVHQLAVTGSSLTEETAVELEEKVLNNPGDIESRIVLLGYYSRNWFAVHDCSRLRLKHIEWIVENRPEHAVNRAAFVKLNTNEHEAYETLKRKWLEQLDIHSHSAVIYGNAAEFFTRRDRTMAEKCLTKARILDAENLKWTLELAELYKQWGHAEKAVHEFVAYLVSLAYPKDAASPNEMLHAFSVLIDLTEAFFDAGDSENAEQTANELLVMSEKLRDHPSYGRAVQVGYTTRGLVDLQRGNNIQQAASHLLQSAINAGGLHIRVSGPNLRLAEKLAAHGETTTVLNYLEQCKAYCSPTHDSVIHFRLRMLHGVENDGSLHFFATCLEEEIRQLKMEPPSRRLQSIDECIRQTKNLLDKLTGYLELEVQDEAEMAGRAQLCKQHLVTLNTLRENG